MNDFTRVIQEIKKLESMIPSGFLGIGDNWDFKELWAQIKSTQEAFDESRFPSQEEHQIAWQDFQNLVNVIKEKQAEYREESAKMRDKIIRKAEMIPPTDDRWVAFILTAGISEIIESLFGESDSRKEALKEANNEMKELWDLVNTNNLEYRDKGTVIGALKDAEIRLQDAWDEWKKFQETKSNELRDQIVGLAEKAVPYDWEEVIGIVGGAVLTEGLSLILELFEDQKSKLKFQSEELQKVWELFKSEKHNLIQPDKDIAYQALKEAQSRLDEAWGGYKKTRSDTIAEFHETKQKRHEEWKNKVKENLESNQQKAVKAENALERKRQNLENNQQKVVKAENALERKHHHRDELDEKLDNATSNSYIERVEGWIEENSDSIQEIEEQLDRYNTWIQEDMSSIQDIEEQLDRYNTWIQEDMDKLNS